MADRIIPAPADQTDPVKEAVCVDTRRIMDSCRDKDCIEDLFVFPTVSSVPSIECALSVRPKNAKLIHCSVRVQPMSLHRGYYTVDVTYFYSVTGETFPGNQTVRGLAVFNKRVMLFGSEGRVKSYYSNRKDFDPRDDDLPIASVDAVDPIVLGMRLVDNPEQPVPSGEQTEIPDAIRSRFAEELCLGCMAKYLFVTLGQFSVIRLERPTQLLIPAYDYCMPDKECVGSGDDDPCEIFSRIGFPVDEFFPPDSSDSRFCE